MFSKGPNDGLSFNHHRVPSSPQNPRQTTLKQRQKNVKQRPAVRRVVGSHFSFLLMEPDFL